MSVITRIIKSLIPESTIKNLKANYHVPDMKWSLENLYKNGFSPKNVVDIGAYEGEWTLMSKKIFGEAKFLMIEAQSAKSVKLDKLKSSSVDYKICLLGPESNKSAKFYVNETVSSALPETEKDNQEYIDIEMFTLDEVLAEKSMDKIDFIKLDVQGFELEVLKGAANSLSSAEVVLMEVSLIEINKGAPLIHEVMNFMSTRGFVCYDICSIVRRPLDNALWQTDLIFVKADSPLVSSKKYR